MQSSITKKPRISIVIPMYNEADNAAHTIARIKDTLGNIDGGYEIIPVNDGSTDQTGKIIEQLANTDTCIRPVSYPNNGGRGKALRYGFKAARGTYVASLDADLSYDPEYIIRMLGTLEANPDMDAVLASAYMPGGSTEGVPLKRLWISRLGNWVLNLSMPENIHTITCVVRCYRREVLECLDLESNGKEIHLEILSKMLAMGFKVVEIPATLKARKKGKSKFAFRSTASSHLLFTIFERPALLFGIIGLILTIIGVAMGIYILALYLNAALNPNRPIINMMLLFVLGGMQILSFGFLASQITYLRKEVLKTRRAITEVMTRNIESGN